MTMDPARFTPARQRGAYRSRAHEVAQRIRGDWERSGERDLKGLVDEVQCALAEEANHELRQVLFQLGAQMELALVKARAGQAPVDVKTVEKLLSAVGRASAIVDTFLDRSEAAKLVMDLETEGFDLGQSLLDILRWNGFLADAAIAEVQIESIAVEGDRERLLDVLSHMASRFYFARKPEQRLVVRVRPRDGRAEGFIGLTEAHITPQELMAEFDKPLRVDDMEIDVPYTRAVIERHGGTLYVAADAERASGFGFTIPLKVDHASVN